MKQNQPMRNPIAEHRKQYWIEPGFQKRFIMRIIAFSSLAVLLTFVICLSLVWWQDRKIGGTFFYLTSESTNDPILIDRTRIILPMLLLSESLVVILMGLVGYFYSHRLAGPRRRPASDVRNGPSATRSRAAPG